MPDLLMIDTNDQSKPLNNSQFTTESNATSYIHKKIFDVTHHGTYFKDIQSKQIINEFSFDHSQTISKIRKES